jgi:hypothetical protein
MPLILAIEPDRRQAAQLSVVVRKRVHAELILVDTTEQALHAIGNRMPDLVLVPALLSPQDDAALAAALRVIAAAARVQMLTIPVLGSPRPAAALGGMLSALRRGKPRAAEPDGCDPAVFAEQVASYLERAAQERPGGVAEEAVMELASADRRPPIESPSLQAIAAVEQPNWTVEDAVNQEWLEPFREVVEVAPAVQSVESVDSVDVVDPADVPPVAPAANLVEPDFAAASDDGVSLALEEAVRVLFADPAQAAVAPARDIAAPVETSAAPALVTANNPGKDEWAAVDELMAALQLMPLAAIEVTDEDDWIAPVLEEPQRVAEALERQIDEPRGGDSAASSPSPSVAKSEREWVALIESLRHDVERLRIERSEKPGRKAAAAAAARPDRAPKPVQDEWGFFDPQQCGFAALLAKLDEVTDSDDGQTNH